MESDFSKASSDLSSGYFSQDTISAVATPLGGAISIIRISGPRAFWALEQLQALGTSPIQKSASQAAPRQMVRVLLHSNLARGQTSSSPAPLLDDALAVRFVSPKSYTGEDCVELHLHGSAFIAQRVMEELAAFGVRQALPGEFSFRAVRNGKLNLYQAQAVQDLIQASNDQAVSLALEKLSGAQNEFLARLAQGLRRLSVLGEIGIDFADQDVEEVSLPHLKKELGTHIQTLEHLRESFHRGFQLQEGIRVTFIGLPNAGKSSFFNALLGEDRSIVSEIAGTTRDLVREKLSLQSGSESITLRLEDTAGLRATDSPLHPLDPIEKMGIARTKKSFHQADLILFLVDPQSSLPDVKKQWEELHWVSSTPITASAPDSLPPSHFSKKTLGILTKMDQVTPQQLSSALEELQSLNISTWVPTSSLQSLGMKEAVQAIVQFCRHLTRRQEGEILLTRLDHKIACEHALEHLKRAGQAPEIDLFAADIKQALHALSPLIGETLADDILGQIFSSFCIGK